MGTDGDDIFRLAPHDALPKGSKVVCLEGDGAICYVIDETASLREVIGELNDIAGHLVHSGVWAPRSGGKTLPPPRMRHAS